MSKFDRLKLVLKIMPAKYFRSISDFYCHYIKGLFQRIEEHHIIVYGGGMAFSLLLSLVPFILTIFFILSQYLESGIIQMLISGIIDSTIPYPDFAEYSKEAIFKRLPEVIEYRTFAGVIGIGGLVFTSTWLFSNMRIILNKTFHTVKRKSAIVGLLRDIGMVVVLIAFITVSTFLLPAFNIIVYAADKIEYLNILRVSEVLDYLIWGIGLLVTFILFFLLFYLIPYEALGKRVPAISAFWTTIMWEGARLGFGYYISIFLNTNRFYGAFILVIGILFWVFYSSCLFIIGAEIGQLFREKHPRILK